MFGVNPLDYSYEYKKVAELKGNGIKYIFIDDVSMVSELMWNVIAHMNQQFGFVFIGFGDFKQLKTVGEQHIDFKHSWIVKYVFNNTICELTDVHRLDKSRLLQQAHKCANGENIGFDKTSMICLYTGLIKRLMLPITSGTNITLMANNLK